MLRVFLLKLELYSMMGAVVIIATAQSSSAQITNPDLSIIAEDLAIIDRFAEPKSLSQTSSTNSSNIESIATENSPWTLVTEASTLNSVETFYVPKMRMHSRRSVSATSLPFCRPPRQTSHCVAADLNQPIPNLLTTLKLSQTLPSSPDDEDRIANNDRLANLSPDPTPGKAPFQPERVPLLPARGQEKPPTASPGITSITPSAYGKSWGSAGIGAGFQARTRFTEKSDGAIAAGIGFGDAREAVGLDVGVAIFNLSDSFGDRGSVSFKLHRLLPDDFAVAVGWQNAIVWGSTDAGNSVYGVATKMFRLQDTTEKPFSRLYVSAGIGSGQYRSEFDINDDNETVGIFGSVALRVAEPVNAIAEWSGQDLTLGVSFVPFRNLPLVITPALTDITGNAGDGARFILGIGYGFSY